ncbi:bifunctional UDP-N-acetylglucosamine diphosphorylase/glucosamine-1-phosphate N-acetyltransferase GlmU [Bryobacter aggregatus]|uniref:bifunctional UDP-N-acetylglucosamine diphosphorylase/glucosamine-1-phosphate N-acetyltransferase GlmU n=1 Tax=Bryobacter aggregatus TaxID=360054 RepID=UPI0004E0F9B4|nr:bifunctional UDP-N-acetylglucosamine diphosphorylase/glucosamine-1-phosphate N-acetyltransferase GlmU [Bryobacter aggregatus]
MQTELSAIVLAAGLGTRMKSRKAKVLHEAGGQALVEHVLDAAGTTVPADRITVVVGHQAEQVRALLAPRGCHFVMQTEQRGTGHAVAMCRGVAPENGWTLLLYGDCPLLTSQTIARLVAAQQRSGAAATLITTVLDDPHGYGRILRAEDGSVAAIVEQKAATPEQLQIREINSGIYCIDSELLWRHIAEIEPNPASGEIYLTDIVEILRRAGKRVEALVLEDASEILGINQRLELAEADRILRARKTKQLMLDGVTIFQPETVAIDAKVEIGQDSVIAAFTQILGKTKIGADCTVGAGTVIRDSVIADGVTIGEYCFVGTSVVETGAQIGPFSRLRLENHVGAGAQIGNFVELKKTRFGAGAKAMHLAYLGDSLVGAGVNIGAGTITCNFDGANKHTTEIGDGVFVGSNSTLVAPVKLEADSYIGAGSVITDPVPGDTLALGRSRQVNKAGWVQRKRAQKPSKD